MRSTVLAAGSLVVALLVPSRRAEAQPTCTAGTLASYAALGDPGCSYGGLTFGGITAFAYSFSGPPSVSILDRVQVTPFTRVSAGRHYVGLAMAVDGGLRTSSAAALAGGSVCQGGSCYQAGQFFNARFRVDGAAFTGAFGLGTRTDREIAAQGTDWLMDAYEQIASLGPGVYASASRHEQAGWNAFPESCYLVAGTNFAAAPCDAPALVTDPGGPLAKYEAVLQLAAITRPGFPAGTVPSGGGSARISGAEYLFGVRAPISTVPEPGTVTLAGAGLALMGAWARRRASR